jgi:ligand-binding SRPBCC domain-containing protein
MSKAYSMRAVQKIPVSPEEAWLFFSDPGNLAEITPGNMGFKIISEHHGDSMYAGQVIEYMVKPVLGIPLYWMTEITQVEQQKYFIDEQRFGPFSLWHHQHFFKEVEGGVEMTDIIHYKLPLGFLGKLAHVLFVKRQLKKIFDHRYRKVQERFGSI